MQLFDRDHAPNICLQDLSVPVKLAAMDLQRDLRRLSGQDRGFVLSAVGPIVIRTVEGLPESYTVEVTDTQVIITGGDALGTVYGIYAFEHRWLGISPVHRLTDQFPQSCSALQLQPGVLTSAPRPVRYRGWFLNDEDLLTELVYSGGKRHIDYPWYGDVMDLSVLDMVLETALRLEINLVIPASFVDILNPDEEKLVSAVCRRGLYVSQHHVEPVGVSWFAADRYLKERGCGDEAVSFVANRSRMEEIWRTYIRAWAAYGDRVIWQLGLRGKGDQAVWVADPNAPMTDADRGALLTDAIATQHCMIAQTLGVPFVSTATLWNEGSELYGRGFLRLPENTIAIFADFGVSQLFGKDFYTMPRLPGKQYGIYYHLAFFARGPHLTEGCRPEKLVYSVQAAHRLDSLSYAIVNVSNVRPVHFGAMVWSAALADPEADAGALVRALDTRLFGPLQPLATAFRTRYYDAFADFGREMLEKTAKKWHFYYKSHEAAPFVEAEASDGLLAFYIRGQLRGSVIDIDPERALAWQAVRRSAREFAALYEDMAASPLAGDPYFDAFLLYQTRHMLLLSRWGEAVFDMLEGDLSAQGRACQCLEDLLQARQVLEQGRWQHYHRGDTKINIPALLQQTREWTPQNKE